MSTFVHIILNCWQPLPFFGMLVEREMKRFIEKGEHPYNIQEHHLARSRLMAFFRQYKDPAKTAAMATIEIDRIHRKYDPTEDNEESGEVDNPTTAKGNTGHSVLMAIGGQMISKNNPEGLDMVLTEYPEMAQATTQKGQNLFHMAAFKGNLALLEVLSKHKVPYIEDELGYTPAWWTVRTRDPRIAKESMTYFCGKGLEEEQVANSILTHCYADVMVPISGQSARNKLETPRPNLLPTP